MPEYYTVPTRPSSPAPFVAKDPGSIPVVGKLEALLSNPGAIESEEAWLVGGLAKLSKNIHAGKKMASSLRLGLMVIPSTLR